MARTIEKSLDAGWFKTWTCYSPADAISLIGRQEPCAVVVDGRTNRESNLEFIRRLKQDLGNGHLPCLFFHAPNDKPGADILAAAGVDEHLAWPTTVAIVGTRLKHLVEMYEANRRRDVNLFSEGVGGGGDESFQKSGTQYQGLSTAIFFRKAAPGAARRPVAETVVEEKADSIELPKDFFDGNDVDLTQPKILHGAEAFGSSRVSMGERDGGGDAAPADFGALSAEKLEEIAARLLNKKLDDAARKQIRRVIAEAVHAEIDSLLPSLIERIRKEL
ncbi:MAG: hypothetical protein M5R36_22415 [Deltaproteobacteria bacterium]|nr:hypothetical protein [Deltaproteobacteria bacterium]